VIWAHHAFMSTRSTEADRGRRRRLVRQWRRSGLTAAEFAEAVGVSIRTLARWRREVESPQRPTVHRAAFVELVATPAAAAPVDCVPVTPISLRFGDGFELHLPPGFDADSLRRAVEVLQPIVVGSSRRIGDAMAAEPAR
jgi:transcriptional regulator with XRE-family HTH domain